MADAGGSRTTINGHGTVTARQRPSLMLMILRLRAAEQTLELGLAKLKKQCDFSTQWLKRLNAISVDFGEPHFDDQVVKDPLARARAAAVKKPPAKDGPTLRGVNVVLTAVWEITTLSTEKILVLVDQLRLEATDDLGSTETPAEPPTWSTPEEQIRGIMAQFQQPPEDDRAPQFLFIARLTDELVEKAYTEAFSQAQLSAKRLARVAGLSPGNLQLHSIHTNRVAQSRQDQIMDRQRCAALLASGSYDLSENDAVSDIFRLIEFTISVNVSYISASHNNLSLNEITENK